MTHKEYSEIIDKALSDYCSRGGSLLDIALNLASKEYVYEYDKVLPEDIKSNLSDKAYQAMNKNEDLPEGIRLIQANFR